MKSSEGPDQSFFAGMVEAIFMNLTEKSVIYKVKRVGGDNQRSVMVSEEKLLYAPGCPVTVAETKNSLHGEVLLCRAVDVTKAVFQLKDSIQKEQQGTNEQDGNKRLLESLDKLDKV